MSRPGRPKEHLNKGKIETLERLVKEFSMESGEGKEEENRKNEGKGKGKRRKVKWKDEEMRTREKEMIKKIKKIRGSSANINHVIRVILDLVQPPIQFQFYISITKIQLQFIA
ncbi:hypothetical protein RhiirA5_410674 [Rhizophagus irregularis]|uniref:Uncharacterized protein n=1 Tax=Rhizophagus irregularis TaxID=588596 RepID=A0A2I1EB84_9GLOM|nr:hypothetical protein RhiirA5_410674 [Rhizophagus irregularis]PKC73586.1 hypothetical protein RhiirA1_388795 [Rhizophagus irregularis]PKY19398.1 hypothetical protein RhiirB3_432441 [Rhizophagus irregularis]